MTKPEPKPGERNTRAGIKAMVLLVWLVVPALMSHPLFPLDYASQYVEDVHGFMENNTTWWELSRSGRVFYVVFPIPWFIGAAVWYEGVFRSRRKRLVINGQEEGIVMLVVGDKREGHLYDIACAFNGFKHIEWWQFPRPISGTDHPPDVTIYYRASLLTNPISWPRIACKPENIVWGYRTMWLEGRYRQLVPHRLRPVLNYELLWDAHQYKEEELDLKEFTKLHKESQVQIMQDNYRMTQAEPGTQKKLTQSSVMVLSQDTRKEYTDQLSDEDRDRLALEYMKTRGDIAE